MVVLEPVLDCSLGLLQCKLIEMAHSDKVILLSGREEYFALVVQVVEGCGTPTLLDLHALGYFAAISEVLGFKGPP